MDSHLFSVFTANNSKSLRNICLSTLEINWVLKQTYPISKISITLFYHPIQYIWLKKTVKTLFFACKWLLRSQTELNITFDIYMNSWWIGQNNNKSCQVQWESQQKLKCKMTIWNNKIINFLSNQLWWFLKRKFWL